MAALNKKETENLQHILKVLEIVHREGFDPKSRNERDKNINKMLKHSRNLLGSVIEMKGYYPK